MKHHFMDFPGSPEVKISSFHFRERGLDPWWAELRSCKPRGAGSPRPPKSGHKKKWEHFSTMWVVALQIVQHGGIAPSLLFSFHFLHDTYHYLTSYRVYLFLWLLSAPAPQLECKFHDTCLFCIPEWQAGPLMAFNKYLLNEWMNRKKHLLMIRVLLF